MKSAFPASTGRWLKRIPLAIWRPMLSFGGVLAGTLRSATAALRASVAYAGRSGFPSWSVTTRIWSTTTRFSAAMKYDPVVLRPIIRIVASISHRNGHIYSWMKRRRYPRLSLKPSPLDFPRYG